MSDAIYTPLPLVKLRLANRARLPTFKNRHGAPAHSQRDGSDWSINDWYTAYAGEMGELMEALVEGDAGDIAQELADCVIYLDLLAFRIGCAPPGIDWADQDALTFARMADSNRYRVAFPNPNLFFGSGLRLGNDLKKLRRGDMALSVTTQAYLGQHVHDALEGLVALAGHLGISLDQAIVDTFNKKSEQVASPITLRHVAGERPLEPANWQVWNWSLGRRVTWWDVDDPDGARAEGATAAAPDVETSEGTP